MNIFDPEVISLGQASLFIDGTMNPVQSKFRSLPGRVSHPIKTPNNRLQTHYNPKSDPSKIIFPTRRDGLRWDVLGATEPVKTPVLSLPRAYQSIRYYASPDTPSGELLAPTLIVTTGPCVARVAYSNSGQPKPQLRGCRAHHNNETTGARVGMRGERVPPRGGYHGVGGGEGGCRSPASYIF